MANTSRVAIIIFQGNAVTQTTSVSDMLI